MVQFHSLVNGPLLSVFFLRSAVRCNNPALYYAAYEKLSLLTFLNNNVNYQCISCFKLYLIKMATKEVKQFIYQTMFHQEKTHQSWDCSCERLDYRLEERNRRFKMNLYTDNPSISDWRVSMSNSD